MGVRRIRIENADSSRNMMEALQRQGVYLPAFCGGKGTCGKCKVRFLQDPPDPSSADRELLGRDELRDGVRLACTSAAVKDAEVEVLSGDEADMEVETSFFGGNTPGRRTVSAADPDVETSFFGGNTPFQTTASAANPDVFTGTGNTPGRNTMRADNPAAGTDGRICGSFDNAVGDRPVFTDEKGRRIAAAVDIGTTTIAMSAVDVDTGEVLNTVTAVNHQRAWGADVISRIDASNRGEGEKLQKSIFSDLDDLRKKLALPENVPTVISGNTTMQHLLQGLPCGTLGVAPYTPVDISLHEYKNMTILPGISTFVGADIVSGIVACGMDRSEEICILVDLGTNGEMAIGNRDRILSASTAAGPAFEGGNISCGIAGIPGAVCSVEITDGEAEIQTIGDCAPAGLCGTGVLETVYELLKEEIIDETGLLDDDYFDDGFKIADGIIFTGKDVREVQLAKSAVRAGMEVLLQVYGTGYDHIGKLYLAGGFGQKINLEKAVGIGLLPEELLDRMQPVGNSSLAGAVMASADPFIRARMAETAAMAQETSLAENPLFSELYMDNMFFPEED